MGPTAGGATGRPSPSPLGGALARGRHCHGKGLPAAPPPANTQRKRLACRRPCPTGGAGRRQTLSWGSPPPNRPHPGTAGPCGFAAVNRRRTGLGAQSPAVAETTVGCGKRQPAKTGSPAAKPAPGCPQSLLAGAGRPATGPNRPSPETLDPTAPRLPLRLLRLAGERTARAKQACPAPTPTGTNGGAPGPTPGPIGTARAPWGSLGALAHLAGGSSPSQSQGPLARRPAAASPRGPLDGSGPTGPSLPGGGGEDPGPAAASGTAAPPARL